MRILALLAVLVVLFGCTQPGQPQANGTAQPQENRTNETNQTVNIIVGPQQNQTAGENTTKPPEPPEDERPGPGYSESPNETLGVYFIDVGGPHLHGNAILVKKGDLDVLIDAGPVENAGKVVDFLNSRNVDDIDLLISTSADPRNYGGMPLVAGYFKVESFWWGGTTFDDSAYEDIVKRMESAPKGSAIVERGNATILNGITFEVLNPPKIRFNDVNNDAVVLRVSDRNFSMLLASSIQNGAEGSLLGAQPDKIMAGVMQAPYYGVGLGTSSLGAFPAFLVKANPRTVIMTGSADESAANGGSRDPFRTLMAQHNITWYENYMNGTLRIMTDGQSYSVQLANGTIISPPARPEAPPSGPAPGTGAGAGSN